MDDRFDFLSEGVLTLDGSGEIVETNASSAALLEKDPSALIGLPIGEALPNAAQPQLVSSDQWANAKVEVVEFFPSLDRWLEIRTVDTAHGMTAYLRDVTDRKRREHDLDARRHEVKTIAQINEMIGTVIGALVGAGSREEIEQTICERLFESELYRFAWIGEETVGDDAIRIRVSSGDSDDVLKRIREGFGGDPPSPEQRALETTQIQSVTGVAEDSAVPEPIRRAAFARGIHSCLAVPMTYGSTVYGVLGIYSDREDPLTARERDSFDALGRMAGFAINATRQRNLVLSDTVIELGYRISDRSSPLVDASATIAAPLSVDGLVPLGDGELLVYVSVVDVGASTLVDALGGATTARPVHGDNGDLVEVHLAGTTMLSLLADLGATIRAAEYDDGVGEVVAALSPHENLQSVHQRLDDTFDGLELLAKRERERSVETAGAFRRTLREQLTDRQLMALQTAYLADYFDSPRGSTSEELADALGITAPTFLHHLRAAERKLMNTFFDDLDPAAHRLESIRSDRDR